MADHSIPLALPFDDVLLLPGRSAVHPAEVDVSSRLVGDIQVVEPGAPGARPDGTASESDTPAVAATLTEKSAVFFVTRL